MKIKLLIMFIATILGQQTYSQTNYYTADSAIINGDGDQYKYCNRGGMVELINVEHNYLGKRQTFKDGSTITPDYIWGNTHSMSGSNLTEQQLLNIVKSKLTQSQLANASNERQHRIMITFYVNSDTGKVSGVNFAFNHTTSYASISPATYREMEVAFKDQLQFTITEAGEKLNYCMLVWHRFIR